MLSAEILRVARREARLSVRALADAAGVAASTVHRIERGDINPTVDMLDRLAAAAGMALRAEPRVDHRLGLVGLALSISKDLAADPRDAATPVRRAAELAHRFGSLAGAERRPDVTAPPPTTGDQRWDAFVGAMGGWLAVRAGMTVPGWAHDGDRYLDRGWWVTEMPSMRAWEYSGSPLSFKVRGVYIHRDSLVNV